MIHDAGSSLVRVLNEIHPVGNSGLPEGVAPRLDVAHVVLVRGRLVVGDAYVLCELECGAGASTLATSSEHEMKTESTNSLHRHLEEVYVSHVKNQRGKDSQYTGAGMETDRVAAA